MPILIGMKFKPSPNNDGQRVLVGTNYHLQVKINETFGDQEIRWLEKLAESVKNVELDLELFPSLKTPCKNNKITISTLSQNTNSILTKIAMLKLIKDIS